MSVHSLRREQMQTGDVYVGRAGHGQDGYFGNRFRIGPGEAPGATLMRFEEWARARAEQDAEYRNRVKGLHGKRLFCFCAPNPCHADVLERLAWEFTQDDGG